MYILIKFVTFAYNYIYDCDNTDWLIKKGE